MCSVRPVAELDQTTGSTLHCGYLVVACEVVVAAGAGVSAGGRYVELRAEMDLIGLISNCRQLNNPCNACNPTPVRLLIWD